MKNIFLVVLINLVLPLFLFVLMPSLLITSRQGTSVINGDQQISIIQKNPISFSFISDKSNFHSLTLTLKNPNIDNNSRVTIDITGPTSSQSLVFYGSNVGDPSSIPLKFPAFSDPPSTTYTVSISTDNTSHDSLYMIVDNHNQPLFKTYYHQSNFITNVTNNFKHQLDLIRQRFWFYNLIYISIIVALNYQILKKSETQ